MNVLPLTSGRTLLGTGLDPDDGLSGRTREASSIQDILAHMQGSIQQVGNIGRAPVRNDRSPRVLIVEDETMISMLIEDMVCDLGGHVVGPAAKFEQAMILALQADFDLAVLDVNVDGLVVYPIADVLRYRGIPFIFVTGYDSSVVPQRYQHNCVLSKPFSHQTFSDALREVFANSSSAPAAC